MNEEIKLILKTMETFTDDSLKIENIKVTTLCLTKNENKLLLNYITNLQKENEHKDKLIDIANAGISNLQKENQKLNKVIDELEKFLKEGQDLPCGCGISIDYKEAYENALDKVLELKKEVNSENEI